MGTVGDLHLQVVVVLELVYVQEVVHHDQVEDAPSVVEAHA